MKFQKYEPFEMHFKESFPQHLAPIYVVVSPKPHERKKILSALIKRLEGRSDFKRCVTMKEAVEHLHSRSLFSQKMGASLDELEGFLQEEKELLEAYVEKPNSEGYFLVGASSSSSISELYKKGKKEMVVLDLSSEKPWEEKDRIKTWAVQCVQSRQKRISPQVIDFFLEQLPLDRGLLQQELEKLFCYVGPRDVIQKEDIEAISTVSKEENFFKVAEQMVFGTISHVPEYSDLQTLLPLIGMLRKNLETGLKMGLLLERGASREEISKSFPKLFPKTLQLCIDGAHIRKTPFFKKGLIALFDLEFGLKTSLGKPGVLFTKFCGELL